MTATVARADLAIAEAVVGPPLRLQLALRSRLAGYLADSQGPRLCMVGGAGVVMPESVVLPPGISWEWLLRDQLDHGTPVVLGNGTIACGARRLAVRADLDLRVPAGSWPPDAVRRAIGHLDRALTASHPVELPWLSSQDLTEHLGDAGPDALLVAADGLIGAGPGLTPSGDDLLAAALLVHVVAGSRGAEEVGAAILDRARTRTTAAAVLQYRGAARGCASPPVGAALTALLGQADPSRALAGLLALGHSSGHDLARGLRAGLAAVHSSPLTGSPTGASAGRAPAHLRPAERNPA